MTKSLEVLSEKNLLDSAIVLTGMNMPMAMTAIIMKDTLDDKAALTNAILGEAQGGVSEFKTIADTDSEEDI